MKKQIAVLFWFVLFCQVGLAQRLGLVMSGGGAKGLAHIGVIKALEENEIPIDYVTGTSIGAIVGSLYAMGYSPDEMAELIRSQEFRFWQSGEVETSYRYYFKQPETLPNYLKVGFSIKDSLRIITRLPGSLIPPIQMNYAFLKLFTQASTRCGSNFDHLFVPFRCVASDVNNKRAHIFRTGDLGNAVRASMTFPLVFKPIVVDGNLMFDGGIYNNFPADVMISDFHPDYIVGSIVASNPSQADENNIYRQLENMILNRTDYTIDPALGTTIDFKLNDIGLLDFDRLDEIVQTGYRHTLDSIAVIKQRLGTRRLPADTLAARRQAFKQSLPPLRFEDYCYRGLTPNQTQYMDDLLNKHGRTFTLADFKKDYFKLLADEKIDEILPHACFNPQDSLYDLLLNIRHHEKLAFLFGGNISTNTSNQAYAGLNYQDFSRYAYNLLIDGQFGRTYTAGRLLARLDIPFRLPFYLKLTANTHTFKYYAGDRIFYEDDRPVSQFQRESYLKLNIGFPLRMESLLELGITTGHLTDTYRQMHLTYPDSAADESLYDIIGTSLRYEASSLNNRQYPITGNARRLQVQYLQSHEYYQPAAYTEQATLGFNNWLQFSAAYEGYFPLHRRWTLGTLAETVLANRRITQNYTATLLQFPAFTPTIHSKATFNKAFRSNRYAAFGIKPIYHIYKQLHLRGEFYAFLPLATVTIDDPRRLVSTIQTALKPEYIAELSLVLYIKSLSLSAYLNHYSSPADNWNFGINFGFLIFNKGLIEK